jgi:hypothetical protein
MPAAEVQLLVDDLRAELAVATETADARTRAARFSLLLESFVLDWRQLCALHGVGGRGRPDFLRLAGAVREAAKAARRRAGHAHQRRRRAAGAREARFTAPRFRLDRLRSPSCERADP